MWVERPPFPNSFQNKPIPAMNALLELDSHFTPEKNISQAQVTALLIRRDRSEDDLKTELAGVTLTRSSIAAIKRAVGRRRYGNCLREERESQRAEMEVTRQLGPMMKGWAARKFV